VSATPTLSAASRDAETSLDATAELAIRDSRDLTVLYALAQQCRDSGRQDLWSRVVEHALAQEHQTQEHLFDRYRVRLTLGDWSGWTDYEARRFKPDSPSQQSSDTRRLRWSHQAWDGSEDISRHSLLIYPEQGFGDCIQMLRFVPLVASRVRHLIVAVQPQLVALVQYNFDSLATVTFSDLQFVPAFDRYMHIMSLPRICGNLPPFVPLSAPDPVLPDVVGSRALRVGLCWAGGSKYKKDALRSLPSLDLLRPLFRDCNGAQWVSLQVGSREQDIDDYAHVQRPDAPLWSFADTASLIVGLDAVITVDTAIAHLAGSLNVPTFLLLPYAASPRWGLTCDRTPWYPSMELIRQPVPGDWVSAIAVASTRIVALTQNLADVSSEVVRRRNELQARRNATQSAPVEA
jgi:hypothetical protein